MSYHYYKKVDKRVLGVFSVIMSSPALHHCIFAKKDARVLDLCGSLHYYIQSSSNYVLCPSHMPLCRHVDESKVHTWALT